MTELRVVPDPSSRPDWDTTWMETAQIISRRSRCVRAQYGAVIVDAQNRVIATGYNGPPAAFPALAEFCSGFCKRAQLGPVSPLDYSDCPAVHAEANALMFCDRRDREGGTIYVNGGPCLQCAKLIANSGLDRVVYLEETGRDYRDPDTALQHLRTCAIEVDAWTG